MAKYVVLEFDNDELADRYVSKLVRGSVDTQKPYRVVGLFKSPRTWCQCPRTSYSEKDSVARGGKYGWWVHLTCRRARMGQHTLNNLVTVEAQMGSKEEVNYLVQSLSISETAQLAKRLQG